MASISTPSGSDTLKLSLWPQTLSPLGQTGARPCPGLQAQRVTDSAT